MKGSRSAVMIAVVGGLLAALAWPAQPAEAGRSWCDDDRGRRGRSHVWPRETVSVVINGRPFHSRRSRFSRSKHIGYTIVTEPLQPVVVLPADHQTVVIDGVTYHYYDGAFYKGGPGAAVVPVPVQVSQAPRDTIIINVPNANGSYMPVTLQANADGTYTGPQGEVYTTKPELAQLKAMYSK